ncbi:hypothetical protein PHMEG_00021249, partial [Phytophthora megakarya]
CQVCSPNVKFHKMGYFVYKCNSSACTSIANETNKCNWFLKVLTCQESKQSHIYQSKHHLSCVASPKMEIALGMNRFIKDKAANGEMPARVMNDMVKAFKIQKADPEIQVRPLSRVVSHPLQRISNVLHPPVILSSLSCPGNGNGTGYGSEVVVGPLEVQYIGVQVLTHRSVNSRVSVLETQTGDVFTHAQSL